MAGGPKKQKDETLYKNVAIHNTKILIRRLMLSVNAKTDTTVQTIPAPGTSLIRSVVNGSNIGNGKGH